MGDPGNKRERPEDGAAKPKPVPPIEEDESEDGDFATPKRDRNGDDDQPL